MPWECATATAAAGRATAARAAQRGERPRSGGPKPVPVAVTSRKSAGPLEERMRVAGHSIAGQRSDRSSDRVNGEDHFLFESVGEWERYAGGGDPADRGVK